MDDNERLLLAHNSISSTNKKLNEVLQHKEEFVLALQAFRQSLDPNTSFEVGNQVKVVIHNILILARYPLSRQRYLRPSIFLCC